MRSGGTRSVCVGEEWIDTGSAESTIRCIPILTINLLDNADGDAASSGCALLKTRRESTEKSSFTQHLHPPRIMCFYSLPFSILSRLKPKESPERTMIH
ncbi:hypothetical protein NQZ68_008476 [Dissostichus eleginoides]|nr:hypothetical protein NQZ68_008476 [Dissostichus eleginoides]